MDALRVGQDTEAPGRLISPLRKQLCAIAIHESASDGELVVHPESCELANLTQGEILHVAKADGVSSTLADSRPSQTPQPKTLHDEAVGNRSPDLTQGRLAVLKVSDDADVTAGDSLLVSLSKDFSKALSLRNHDKVWLSKVQRPQFATHIEIIIKDEHVTRGDMWRMIKSELAGKLVYKGQKISLAGAVKAQVKIVFVGGERVQSALFGDATRPIFRSESAHLTILIQMSKEMWDFDADGSGEIMGSRVLEGFLPELFRRWQRMNVRHLVTVVLFTRMEHSEKSEREAHSGLIDVRGDGGRQLGHTDFYRVVASALPSEDTSSILSHLKTEFKVFLRDVSVREGSAGEFVLLGKAVKGTSDDTEIPVLRGSPSVAVRCNILEAINLTLRQHFQEKVVDQDLGRTGVSIILISPGTGLYQVKQSLLRTTTDHLTEKGVSIELICLSRMPLHSVPLFMYTDEEDQPQMHSVPPVRWSYSIPRWIDVSYWTTPADKDRNQAAVLGKSVSRKASSIAQRKMFRPRVRLHELQMMGIMENAIEPVCLPRLAVSRAVGYDAAPQMSLLAGPYHASRHVEDGAGVSKLDGSNIAATGLIHTFREQNPNTVVHLIEHHDASVFVHEVDNSQQPVPVSDVNEVIPSLPSKLQTSQDIAGTPVVSMKQPSRSRSDRPQSSGANAISFTAAKHNVPAPSEIAAHSIRHLTRKPSGLLRKISLGPWAAGVSNAKATASIQITNNDSELATLTSRKDRPNLNSDVHRPGPVKRLATLGREISTSNPGALAPNLNSTPSSDGLQAQSRSRPIAVHGKSSAGIRPCSVASVYSTTGGEGNEEISKSQGDNTAVGPEEPSAVDNLACWLSIVNPSNPAKGEIGNMHSISSLGRWQHVFPRPLRTSKMKWKSLCSPAILPITTELFPGLKHLAAGYDKDDYHVVCGGDRDNVKMPSDVLLHELVAVRLSQGWQLITDDKNNVFAGINIVPPYTDKVDGQFWLSQGGKVHRLTTVSGSEVNVCTYTRGMEGDGKIEPKEVVNIKAVLSPSYHEYQSNTFSQGEYINWKTVDRSIAKLNLKNDRETCFDGIPVASLRYVLLPSRSSYGSAPHRRPSEGDDEEEARLEGIRALTQDWLRYRFKVQDEKGLQVSMREKKDPNPFDILYQTRDPSEIVAAELDNLHEIEAGSRPVQLLPESELFSRNDINLTTFAQTLQGEKGISMRDRRWHLRLHHNSFVGFEFTTWLVQNFRDVETREEAVDLGNELMKNGLFEHVQQRHNFRDGNYFYFITNGYRVNRPISRGNWFGSLRPSVPSTPAIDSKPTDVPKVGLHPDISEEDNTSTKPMGHGPNIALSKSLLYNVDHRGRSYRPEIIRLHYDRLHNPDNCYHIQIEWLNVTPKLIADVIDRWASTVSKYGLRLVEVPISEACAIIDTHPFLAPYVIKLADPPPNVRFLQDQGMSFHDRNHSSFDGKLLQAETSPAPNRQMFHIAILKRFSFILDFEAASSFPSTANVTYSWGAPSYRLPQYIHQSGTLVAQITKDGNFLLLANRLYRERTSTIERPGQDPRLDNLPTHALFAESGRRAVLPNDWSSPVGGGSSSTSPRLSAQKETRSDPRNATKLETTREVEKRIIGDFEQFCGDVRKLEVFYKEVLENEKNADKSSNVGNGANPGVEVEVPALTLPMRNHPRAAHQ